MDEGPSLGTIEGLVDGRLDGLRLGGSEGDCVSIEGDSVGVVLELFVGPVEGKIDGTPLGSELGLLSYGRQLLTGAAEKKDE